MAQTAKKSTGRPKSAPKSAPQAVAKTTTPVIKETLLTTAKNQKYTPLKKAVVFGISLDKET